MNETISMSPTSSLQQQTLLSETRRIWELVRAHYTGPNGLVNHFVDPFHGTVIQHQNTIQDYGDYLQYAAWAGQLLPDASLSNWVLEQVATGSRLFQTSEGFFWNKGTTSQQKPSRLYAHYFRLEDNSDLLMGLVSVYQLTRHASLLPIINRLVDFIDKHTSHITLSGNVFVVLPTGAVRLPFRFSDGLFIEELVHLWELTQEKRYLNLAQRLQDQWEKVDYVRTHGIFPIAAFTYEDNPLVYRALLRFPKIRHRLKTSYFIKSNTNMLSGELAVFRATGDLDTRKRIMRWTQFVETHLLRNDGFFFGTWNADTAKAGMGGYPLADNHHLLNIFEDAAYWLKEPRFLEIAEKNAAFWLSKRSPIRLFPELYKRNFEHAAILDQQVDYLVTLLKLYHLTGKNIYLETVEESTQAVIKHFEAPFGLKWCIDASTGDNMKPYICSKFLSLFTKLALLLHQTREGKNLYSDPLLFDMSRDR